MSVGNNGINTNSDAEFIHEIKHKPYSKPHLEKLGDLRALTLGGSPGSGDSGAGSFVEKFGFAPTPTFGP